MANQSKSGDAPLPTPVTNTRVMFLHDPSSGMPEYPKTSQWSSFCKCFGHSLIYSCPFSFIFLVVLAVVYTYVIFKYPLSFYIDNNSSAMIPNITDQDHLTTNWGFGVFVENSDDDTSYDQVNASFLQRKQVLAKTTLQPVLQLEGTPDFNIKELHTDMGSISVRIDDWLFIDNTDWSYESSRSLNNSCAVVYVTLELTTTVTSEEYQSGLFDYKDNVKVVCEDFRVTFCSSFSRISEVDCTIVRARAVKVFHKMVGVLAILTVVIPVSVTLVIQWVLHMRQSVKLPALDP